MLGLVVGVGIVIGIGIGVGICIMCVYISWCECECIEAELRFLCVWLLFMVLFQLHIYFLIMSAILLEETKRIHVRHIFSEKR